MGERIKENYYIIVRIIFLMAFNIYGLLDINMTETGVSILVLLLVASFILVMSVFTWDHSRLTERYRTRGFLLLASASLICLGMIYFGGLSFYINAVYMAFELLGFFKASAGMYFTPYVFVFALDWPRSLSFFIIVTLFLVCYLEQDFVISSYKKQMMEETIREQRLKRHMDSREQETKEELKKGMLVASNKILEERSNLAQALHDKLGHSINGSVYQLEAIKVLMDKDTDKSREMIQRVIDQLRTGMDEIRAILRKERPNRKELALLQLYKLCEDCNNKGVETDLETEGDISVLSDAIWEIILDNSFEAVSNSMKYAKCRKILISIKVMNKLVRCTIRDDGVGCAAVKDGMGISGMRRRVRSINGSLDFSTSMGFTVSMLLPLV